MLFKKNKLTTQAVFDLYSRVADGLDKGNYAYSVLLDFAKTFDNVDQKILLSKFGQMVLGELWRTGLNYIQ